MIMNASPRERFVRDKGFEPFYYSGKMSDAPRTIKGFMREKIEGWYAYKGKVIYGPLSTPYSTELEAMEEAFYHVLADVLLDEHSVYIETDERGYWAKRKGRLGGSVTLFRKPSDSEYDEIVRAALHQDVITSETASIMEGPDFVYSLTTQFAPLSNTEDTYGIFTNSGSLVAMVSHGTGGELGRPEHDARMFASASRMYELLGELVSIVDPKDIPNVQARADAILRGVIS